MLSIESVEISLRLLAGYAIMKYNKKHGYRPVDS